MKFKPFFIQKLSFGFFLFLIANGHSQEISISGRVLNSVGNPLPGTIVSLPSQDLSDTTDSDGNYNLNKNSVGIDVFGQQMPNQPSLFKKNLYLPEPAIAHFKWFTATGATVFQETKSLPAGRHDMNPNFLSHSNSFHYMIVTLVYNGKMQVLTSLDEKANAQKPSSRQMLQKSSAVLDTIVFIRDGQFIKTTEIESYIATIPDLLLVQRDFSGDLVLDKSAPIDFGPLNHVTAEIENADFGKREVSLWINETNKSYSGFIYFEYLPEVKTYSATVRTFDSNNRKIGQSSSIEFTSRSGNVSIPPFEFNNALPDAFAGPDTTVGINDVIILQASGTDTLGGNLEKFEWKTTPGSWFAANTDTTILAPAIPGELVCSLRVTDNDGNVAYDEKLVTIIASAPIADVGYDTLLAPGEMIHLSAAKSSDDGEIKEIAWKIGEGPWNPVTGDTSITAPDTMGTLLCSLRVKDDEDNFGYDQKTVWVRGPADSNEYVVLNMDSNTTTMRANPTLIIYVYKGFEEPIKVRLKTPESNSSLYIREKGFHTVEFDIPITPLDDCILSFNTIQQYNGPEDIGPFTIIE